ncbi:MAG: CaiB/BaiF CoA-transferase family protein [Proteobacteria bacterium]|nr:CaiB/BaiF CoA-transferase family protein [Pseudomonadota bacterium]
MEVQLNGDGPARGPLRGVTVLDLSSVVSGPFCAQVLGDFGADVWKLESLRGDTSRFLGLPGASGYCALFAQFNRNKRSIALDLKQPQGQEVARRLARRADVLLENYRPGVADRLGLGYEVLAAENPGLIYVSINGFGPEGPYVDYPAYDTVIQGLVGFMPIQGDEDDPRLIRHIAADKATGLTATYAIMAALFERQRGDSDGRGQRVDVPMLDAYAAFTLPDVLGEDTFVPKRELPTPPLEAREVHRAWRTADGFVVMLIIEDSQFQGICRTLDRPELIDDPRCVDLPTRIANARELFGELADEIRKWTTADLVERARRFGAPLAPANSIADFLADPQVAVNRTVFETDADGGGRLRLLRNPVRFHASPASLRRLPPRHGQHSAEILREAGYADAEVEALREAGVVVGG